MDSYSAARARLDAALDDYLDTLEQLEATPPYEALWLSHHLLRGELDRRFHERMQRYPAVVRIDTARAVASRFSRPKRPGQAAQRLGLRPADPGSEA